MNKEYIVIFAGLITVAIGALTYNDVQSPMPVQQPRVYQPAGLTKPTIFDGVLVQHQHKGTVGGLIRGPYHWSVNPDLQVWIRQNWWADEQEKFAKALTDGRGQDEKLRILSAWLRQLGLRVNTEFSL